MPLKTSSLVFQKALRCLQRVNLTSCASVPDTAVDELDAAAADLWSVLVDACADGQASRAEVPPEGMCANHVRPVNNFGDTPPFLLPLSCHCCCGERHPCKMQKSLVYV